ncbi:hypothetical protein EUGRSUZ_F00086 [Eucalyptus grandis]|uniref:Uncharacterized protein n=2 Tax=Eucalyptus grandis TaxID=71139 RepID=A0ACC3KAQ5_EUCGR|nr:hypothetical protein EUGRSUZ_F00086 [Eucalyptus grandis]
MNRVTTKPRPRTGIAMRPARNHRVRLFRPSLSRSLEQVNVSGRNDIRPNSAKLRRNTYIQKPTDFTGDWRVFVTLGRMNVRLPRLRERLTHGSPKSRYNQIVKKVATCKGDRFQFSSMKLVTFFFSLFNDKLIILINWSRSPLE